MKSGKLWYGNALKYSTAPVCFGSPILCPNLRCFDHHPRRLIDIGITFDGLKR